MGQDLTSSRNERKVLLDLEHFVLVRDVLTWDHPMQGQDGYVIENKITGVREAEGVDYSISILAVHNYQAALVRRFEDPDGSLGNAGFNPDGSPGPAGPAIH